MSTGHSGPDGALVLLVVEGQKAEPRFLKALASVFGINVRIVPVFANLHMLYGKMKELDFDCDVRDALKELKLPAKQQRQLDKKFAYTYLVFDCDVQHDEPSGEGAPSKSQEEKFAANMRQLVEMADYFDNETDPSKGRLYVNWPMLESFRDCNGFFDEDYKDRFVPVAECGGYKESVGKRKNASVHLRRYGVAGFSALVKMNLWKLGLIFSGKWEGLDYGAYRDTFSKGRFIAERQEEFVLKEGKVAVLNTSLFFPVDYFGKPLFHGIMNSSCGAQM